MIEITKMVLGPVLTNVYIVSDPETKDAVVVDPAWDGILIHNRVVELELNLNGVWLTHAHFDHCGGTAELVNSLNYHPPTALHSDDMSLWRVKGGGLQFGFDINLGPEPSIELSQGQKLLVGSTEFEVLHTPGHTRGHVVYYSKEIEVAICGDLIFYLGIGRTDISGGNHQTLIKSIRTHIFNLPDNTRLLPGHGPETSVGFEKLNNPFL